MAIDLLLVTILAKAGGSVFLGIVAALVLFKASAVKQRTSFMRASVRFTLRILGAVLLFLVIGNGVSKLVDRGKEIVTREEDEAAPVDVDAAGNLDLDFEPNQLPALAGSFVTLSRANDSVKVKEAAAQILRTAKENGATTVQLHNARAELIGMLGDENRDSSDIRAVDSALITIARPLPKMPAPGDELESQRKTIQRLQNRNERLEDDLEEARNAHGIRAFLSGAADDLGVGFGWSAVYFTAFWALWRGQTPGKRFANLRVLRLDGKPMGWWLSFERFGGYAASLSVGLLGFAQILWDRNRQGLHDKATETVVVQDSAQALSRS